MLFTIISDPATSTFTAKIIEGGERETRHHELSELNRAERWLAEQRDETPAHHEETGDRWFSAEDALIDLIDQHAVAIEILKNEEIEATPPFALIEDDELGSESAVEIVEFGQMRVVEALPLRAARRHIPDLFYERTERRNRNGGRKIRRPEHRSIRHVG